MSHPLPPLDDLRELFPAPEAGVWWRAAESSLRDSSLDDLRRGSPEGVELHPIYTAEDLEGLLHLQRPQGGEIPLLGRPGSGDPRAPAAWEILQERLATDSCDTGLRKNAGASPPQPLLLRLALSGASEEGTTFPASAAIHGLEELETAVRGVDLPRARLVIDCGSAGLYGAGLALALCSRRGLRPDELRLELAVDAFSECALRGAPDVDEFFGRQARLASWAREHAPGWVLLRASGVRWHEAGADAARELACVLGAGADTLRRLGEAGGPGPDFLAPGMRLELSASHDLFSQVAKLRVARLLWAKVAAAFCGDGVTPRVTILARTSGVYHSRIDPWNNLLRSSLACFAAAVGGADGIRCGHMLQGLGRAEDFHRRLAFSAQIMLQREACLDRILDPAGGSWYMEPLCDELGRKAWASFKELEAAGGFYEALQAGIPQAWAARGARELAERLARRSEILVGCNKYPGRELLPFEETGSKEKRRRSQKVPGGEDATIRRLVDHVRGLSPLDDPSKFLQALEGAFTAGARLGDLPPLDAWAEGKSASPATLPHPQRIRAAEPFERRRQLAAEIEARRGEPPAVFLARLGSQSGTARETQLCRNLFACGGFRILGGPSSVSPEDAATVARTSGADACALCLDEHDIPQNLQRFLEAFRSADAKDAESPPVLLAGSPELEGLCFEAGVGGPIHEHCHIFEILDPVFRRLGERS